MLCPYPREFTVIGNAYGIKQNAHIHSTLHFIRAGLSQRFILSDITTSVRYVQYIGFEIGFGLVILARVATPCSF